MRAREWYRIALVFAPLLTVAEIAVVREERRARADKLEAFDASDVLEAHGVEVAL